MSLWMRTKGLIKAGICALGCAGTVAGYVPFVVGAALLAFAVGAQGGSEGALGLGITILASPALFAAESLSGLKQIVTGKPESFMGYMMNKLAPAETTDRNSTTNQNNLNNEKVVTGKVLNQENSIIKQTNKQTNKHRVLALQIKHNHQLTLF